MRRWAPAFFLLALASGILGSLGIAAAAAGVARLLFFVFALLFLVTLVGGLVRRV